MSVERIRNSSERRTSESMKLLHVSDFGLWNLEIPHAFGRCSGAYLIKPEPKCAEQRSPRRAFSSSLSGCQQRKRRPGRCRNALRVAVATWWPGGCGPAAIRILPVGKKASSPSDHLIHAGDKANVPQREQDDSRVERFRR